MDIPAIAFRTISNVCYRCDEERSVDPVNARTTCILNATKGCSMNGSIICEKSKTKRENHSNLFPDGVLEGIS